MGTPDAQLERLLEEAEWIRRLARALVGDEGDDLAQDAWVAVLRRPPDPARPPRPWLRRVIANLRAARARAFVRRRERESASVDDRSASVDPETLAARMQLQIRLAHAIVELPEPFRATVIACYYDGRTPSAIARAVGVPPGTVRWRLKRALELLRARMDREADPRSWRLALLPLASAGRSAGPAAGALFIGGAAVKGAKIAAVVVVLLLLVAALWRWQPWERRPGGPEPAEAAAGTHGARAGQPGEPGAAGTAASGTAADQAPIPAWFVQQGAPHRRVAGIVVGAGKPVGGATVTLASILTEAGYRPEQKVETGPDGRFDLGLQAPALYTVAAAAAGFTSATQEINVADPRAQPAPDQLVLELGRCRAVLTGIVHDATGGVIQGATVRRSLQHIPSSEFGPGVTTDAAGRYELCAWGSMMLEASAPGYGGYATGAIVQGRTTHDFWLYPEAQVFGRVVSRASGAPVPRAYVLIRPAEPTWLAAPRRALTDSEGRFRLSQVAPGRHRLSAYGEGFVAPKEVDVQVTPGELAPEVTLVVETAGKVSGTLLASGAPVAGAKVSLGQKGPPYPPWIDPQHAVSQADGRFVIQDVTSGELAFAVEGHKVLSPATVTVGAQPIDVVVNVAPLGGIRGRVVRGGAPVEDAEVSAENEQDSAEARSRPDGTFELAGLGAGTYLVHATSESLGARLRKPLRVKHTEGGFEQIEVSLDGVASIAGKVVDADGRPLSGVEVRWLRADGVTIGRANEDWARGATDAGGHYQVGRLLGGGAYRAEVRRTPLAAVTFTPVSRFPLVDLPDADSHERDVVLRVDMAGASISGRTVMSGGGQPAPDVRVIALPAGARFLPGYSDLPTAVSTDDGSFAVEGLSAGRYDLQATSPAGAIVKVRAVPAGRTGVVVEVPATGAIEGTLRGFSSPPEVSVHRRPCEIAKAGDCYRVLAQVRGTSFSVAALTPGTYAVKANGVEAAVVEVKPGAVARVALTPSPAPSPDTATP